MTEFLDGPAAGVVLMLRRSPKFLRVVAAKVNAKRQATFFDDSSPTLTWDALDQLADTPNANETPYAYRLVSANGIACIRSGKGKGCYPMAKYTVVPHQPDDAVMRSTEQWQQWCWDHRTQEDLFGDILRKNPNDEAARQAFADWLDEHDRHAEAARVREGKPR